MKYNKDQTTLNECYAKDCHKLEEWGYDGLCQYHFKERQKEIIEEIARGK